MAFFQVDDKFHANRKVMSMIDEEGPSKAGQAVMLWTLAGSLSRDAGLDGVITLAHGARLITDRAATKRAAALLVKHGLWHAPGHDCEKCPQPPDGAWIFHEWFQFRYGTGEAERTKNAKARELRDDAITEAVWARDARADGTFGCRYCEKPVTKPARGGHGGARRGKTVGHLDHVDPTKAIGASNIAVTCADCNQKKGQRTPEQAGMVLLPPPAQRPSRSSSDQVGDQVAIKSESSSEVSPARARARRGAGGVGNGEGSRKGEAGSSAGSAGVGLAGAAPTVPVAARFGSPWKGHHGPPPDPDLIDQATCAQHDQPLPCRVCLDEGIKLAAGGGA